MIVELAFKCVPALVMSDMIMVDILSRGKDKGGGDE